MHHAEMYVETIFGMVYSPDPLATAGNPGGGILPKAGLIPAPAVTGWPLMWPEGLPLRQRRERQNIG